MTSRLPLTIVIALACTHAAWADDECHRPVAQWQPREAVAAHVAAQGITIDRLHIDDGCYEVRGTDAQGRAFKAKIDPETLKVLKMKQDQHQRARERDHGEDGAARQTRPPPPDGAAVPSPLLTPGTVPRGQTE